APPAEHAAQQAAQDLPADLAADGARRLLGHGFDHALAPARAEQRVLDDLAETALAVASLAAAVLAGQGIAARGRRVVAGAGFFGLARKAFGSGLAVDRVVVLRADRA